MVNEKLKSGVTLPSPYPEGVLRCVEVEWRDSMGQAGWNKREEIERDAASPDYLGCSSVGYLLLDEETYITIVQSQNPAGQVGEPLTIPREAVTRIRDLP